MQDDEFERDDAKAERNLREHDVSFDIARVAFSDPGFIDEDDPDPDEDRYKRICMRADALYVVVYTERGSRTRIISARRADRHEQRRYYDR